MAHRSPGPFRKRFLRFSVFIVLVLSASFWFLSKQDGTPTSLADHFLMNIAFPFQKAVTYGTNKTENVIRNYLFLVDTKRENKVLKHRIDTLESETVRLEELKRENTRLRKLLNFRKAIKTPMLPAEIIAKSPTPWIESFVIDKGTKDGIRQGMPVISEKGVVGYILKTTRYVSTVMLLTHYNCRVDAIIQRTRCHGVVGGLLEGRCRLFNALRTGDIVVGDKVITSGFGNRFPRGLLIGTVHKILKKPFGLFQEAEITPSVDFSKLEEVYVLLRHQSHLALTPRRKSPHE